MQKINCEYIHKTKNINCLEVLFGTFASYSSVCNKGYIVPIIYKSKQLFVQMQKCTTQNINHDNGDIILNKPDDLFIDNLENHVIGNLKSILQKIDKATKLTNKNFSYIPVKNNVCLSFDKTTNIYMCGDNEKLCMEEFKKLNPVNMNVDVIVELYVNICETTKKINLIFNLHQLKVNKVEKVNYVIDDYSFMEDTEVEPNTRCNNDISCFVYEQEEKKEPELNESYSDLDLDSSTNNSDDEKTLNTRNYNTQRLYNSHSDQEHEQSESEINEHEHIESSKEEQNNDEINKITYINTKDIFESSDHQFNDMFFMTLNNKFTDIFKNMKST